MRMVLMCAISILFMGCYFEWTPTEDSYTCDAPLFADLESVRRYCLADIAYKSDIELYGQADYWAAPDQTLSNMAGDCEDKAILFAYIAHNQFNERPEIIMEQVGNNLHVYCLIGDTKYLTYTGWNSVIVQRWTYEEAIWIAVHKHSL